MSECPKNMQGGVNPGNRVQSSSVAPLDRDGPRGTNFGIGGGENHSMQSLAAKSKRIL